MKQFVIGYIAILLVVISLTKNIQAKRGCAAFGHSCFGGHGKRQALPAGINSNNLDNSDLPQVSQNNPVKPIGDDFETNAYARRFALYVLLKQWLEEYKRSRQINEGTLPDGPVDFYQ